ncbi:hypothetical protein DER45DRAFT_634425 [Fusarium avenaceum]|nr:hypothetical protein DER45DRAFT_634425 [Fusarium avenaceum]
MSDKRSYKEFKSLGEGVTGRFPLADEPVNPAQVSSRRPHIKAFLTYMLPGVEENFDRWWEEATEFVAASYEKQGIKAVPTETFDHRVDKEAFNIFFEAIQSVHELYYAPDWPWSISDVEAADDGALAPSKLYQDYIRKKKIMATKAEKGSGQDPMEGVTTGEETAIPSPAASGSTRGLAEVSVETLKGKMKREKSLKESVETLWKQYRGANAIIGPVVAPFTLKLEAFIHDAMVHESDLPKLNELLWCCKVVYRRAESLLLVQFTAGNGPSPERSCVEFLKTWSTIKSWLNEVCNMIPITLYEYFQYVQMVGIGIEGHPEVPDEFLAQKLRIDEDYGAVRETITRSLVMRTEVYGEVRDLITSDANETDQALSQWILSRPADARLICARIAAWEWLNRCDISLTQKVAQWGSIVIAKHTNPSADEDTIE